MKGMWYLSLLDKDFKNEPYLRNGCQDLMQKPMSFNDGATVFAKGSNYRIHFWYMSKDDTRNIMTNSNLNEKIGLF